MKIVHRSAVLATAAAIALAVAAPANSAPLYRDRELAKPGPTGIEQVRWRGHRHWHGGYRHHHRHGWGPLAGGLAAGAIIGGAIASSQARAAETQAFCSQRYRSYDPASGTYLGYDGQRHPCP